jgi:hypothetical protein
MYAEENEDIQRRWIACSQHPPCLVALVNQTGPREEFAGVPAPRQDVAAQVEIESKICERFIIFQRQEFKPNAVQPG